MLPNKEMHSNLSYYCRLQMFMLQANIYCICISIIFVCPFINIKI